MLIEIIGGSGSGKSEFAEKCCMELCPGKKYYIATMQAFDEEGKCRVLRHRKLRAGKQFITIECQTGLENVQVEEGATLLLECMSNLTANEMYSPEGRYGKAVKETCEHREEACEQREDVCEQREETCEQREDVCERREDACEDMVNLLMQGIRRMADQARHLVIVTNQVFSDGIMYDASTMEYLRILARVNQEIAAMADEVYEVVHGIPVMIKPCKKRADSGYEISCLKE